MRYRPHVVCATLATIAAGLAAGPAVAEPASEVMYVDGHTTTVVTCVADGSVRTPRSQSEDRRAASAA